MQTPCLALHRDYFLKYICIAVEYRSHFVLALLVQQLANHGDKSLAVAPAKDQEGY